MRDILLCDWKCICIRKGAKYYRLYCSSCFEWYWTALMDQAVKVKLGINNQGLGKWAGNLRIGYKTLQLLKEVNIP